MSIEEDIVKAKENLQNALGNKFDNYMLSMKKWFSGKSTKQEFDCEAREIVTDNFVTEAASKPIYPPIPGYTTNKTPPQRPKKRQKTETSAPSNSSSRSTSYHLRFVPVDSIKHAPSIITPSFDTAHFADKDFSLEFCSRERSLPYFKMIHGRLLLGAIDYNLQHIDIKAVFLLAEATVWMLKNIITKLSSRSNFKHKLRRESAYENYKRVCLTDKKILHAHEKNMGRLVSQEDMNERFEIDPNMFKANRDTECQVEFDSDDQEMDCDSETAEQKEDLKGFSNQMNNSLIVPQKKLPTTLFDLKNLLQCHRQLMPSHSIYIINMEKLICNLWHEDDIDLKKETT